jgi:hypothetical protein
MEELVPVEFTLSHLHNPRHPTDERRQDEVLQGATPSRHFPRRLSVMRSYRWIPQKPCAGAPRTPMVLVKT